MTLLQPGHLASPQPRVRTSAQVHGRRDASSRYESTHLSTRRTYFTHVCTFVHGRDLNSTRRPHAIGSPDAVPVLPVVPRTDASSHGQDERDQPQWLLIHSAHLLSRMHTLRFTARAVVIHSTYCALTPRRPTRVRLDRSRACGSWSPRRTTGASATRPSPLS